MPVTLAKIAKQQGKNPTGLKAIYVTDIDNVLTIPAPAAHVISTDIGLEPGAVFTKIEFDNEAGAVLTIDEPDANGTTGDVYTLNAFVAGNSSAQKDAMEAHKGVELAIITEDKAGVRELLFEVGRGIRLRKTKEDGQKAGTRRGHLFQGTMDFNNDPYQYTGAIAE